MPSASGHYDENLLAAAPVTTKAQIQEGYSTDLLNTPPSNVTPPVLSSSQVDVERGTPHKEYIANPNPTPFFRTKKGKITIVFLIIVILAAIIGGAVGGSTQNHKNSNDRGNQTQAMTSGSSSAMSGSSSAMSGGTIGNGETAGENQGSFVSTPSATNPQRTVTGRVDSSEPTPPPDGLLVGSVHT